jgi:hypothetical protein
MSRLTARTKRKRHMKASPTKNLAIRWRVSSRTIQRMRRRGVDLENPEDVARYALSVKNPSQGMLEVLTEETAPATLNEHASTSSGKA